jgi:hypothetical protein
MTATRRRRFALSPFVAKQWVQLRLGSDPQRQPPCNRSSYEEYGMTNMIIYLIGTLLVVAGLAYGASRVGVSQVWIVAGALVIVGLGLMAGIVKTRQKDPAS